MATQKFIPLSARNNAEALEEHLELFEGVESWFEVDLVLWVMHAISVPAPYEYARNTPFTFSNEEQRAVESSLLRQMTRTLRLQWPKDLDLHQGTYVDYFHLPLLEGALRGFGSKMFDICDYLLQEGSDVSAEDLEFLLEESGSAWAVAPASDAKFQLVRRVDPTVVDAVAELIDEDVVGSKLLLEAWTALHGRSPDHSNAYRKAIAAIERALAPIVSPKNLKPTLGTIAINIRDQKDWRFGFDRDAADRTSSEVLSDLLRLVYAGQVDRHPTGEQADAEVTYEAAVSAVSIAMAVLQWVRAGAVRRVPISD